MLISPNYCSWLTDQMLSTINTLVETFLLARLFVKYKLLLKFQLI